VKQAKMLLIRVKYLAENDPDNPPPDAQELR